MMVLLCDEAMLTTLPARCSSMAGRTARHMRQTPSRSTAIQRPHSASVVSSGSWKTLMPALLTSTSMRPKRSRVSVTQASTEMGSVTSVWTKRAAGPSRSAVAGPGVSSLSAMTTRAPSLTKASAMAAARPRPAPVTMAILPLRRILPIHDGAVGEDGVLRVQHFLGVRVLGAFHLVNDDPEARCVRDLPEAVDPADRPLDHVEVPGDRAHHFFLNDMV